jgi:hypothetical protein
MELLLDQNTASEKDPENMTAHKNSSSKLSEYFTVYERDVSFPLCNNKHHCIPDLLQTINSDTVVNAFQNHASVPFAESEVSLWEL